MLSYIMLSNKQKISLTKERVTVNYLKSVLRAAIAIVIALVFPFTLLHTIVIPQPPVTMNSTVGAIGNYVLHFALSTAILSFIGGFIGLAVRHELKNKQKIMPVIISIIQGLFESFMLFVLTGISLPIKISVAMNYNWHTDAMNPTLTTIFVVGIWVALITVIVNIIF